MITHQTFTTLSTRTEKVIFIKEVLKMTARRKEIFIQLIILAVVIMVVIFGGRYERGYYAVASEPMVLAVGIFLIYLNHKLK